MATTVKRTLRVEYGQGGTYLTADGLSLDVSVLGVEMLTRLYMQGNDGYAIYNSTSMDILYPNATAHPVKADSSYHAGMQMSNSKSYIDLEFDGTGVHKCFPETYDGKTPEETGLTDAAILNSTKSSTIRYHHYASSKVNAIATTFFELSLYFTQYACSANAVGNGVAAASVDKAEAYDGDSVTFTATLNSGAIWHGWYSDAACTNLVSTQQSYTVTAEADTYLFAYATANGTGLYLKRNGAFIEAQGIYRKVNGAWEPADKTAFSTETKYKLLN